MAGKAKIVAGWTTTAALFSAERLVIGQQRECEHLGNFIQSPTPLSPKRKAFAMSKDSRTNPSPSPTQGGGAPRVASKTGSRDGTGLFGMLMVAIAAALLVGTLSFLIFMPSGSVMHAQLSTGASDHNTGLLIVT